MNTPTSAAAPVSSGRGRNTCAACGRYAYHGRRHLTCPPAWRSHRFQTCDRCGLPGRGSRHRKCGDMPHFRLCGYCSEPTRGRFHNRCAPIGLGYFATFPDMPAIVQRRCTDCLEWYPFASIDGAALAGTTEAWSPHGVAQSGRTDYFQARCRACLATTRALHRGEKAA